jgi:cell division protein FtsA
MARPDPNLVAIDIGSSKVAVLIAKPQDDGELEIIGKGRASNRGTRKGNIVNIDATVDALRRATEEAEVMAGTEISRAYVGVAGTDVRSVNSRGMVSVARKNREITRQDIDRVLEAAQAAALPSDREILHAIPQEFVVDEQGGIAEPMGMLGHRLEVAVHLVTANTTRRRTLLTCVNRAGVEVLEAVFEPLATAEAVLTHDERELGSLLLDVGGGTTEFAFYSEGEVMHSGVLPIGAGHFTSDIGMVLRTPFAEAERIKLRHGCCLAGMLGEDEGISVPTVAGGPARVIPKRQLCDILQPRAQELLELVRRELEINGYEESLRGGVVLTGGGAQLDGLLELAEQVFNTGVRYGLPQGLGGLVDVIRCPTWSAASGLVLYGHAAHVERKKSNVRHGFSMRGMMGNLRERLSDLL